MKNRTTSIRWTKHTWNPAHGCSKVSAGCQNCYAERLSLKRGFTQYPWTEPHASKNVQLKPHRLTEPDRIFEPSMIFVNSMSDLFHGMIPDSYIGQVCQVMHRNRKHTFQVLTKRPSRAAKYIWPYPDMFGKPGHWPAHVWLGTSIEDQRTAEQRIPYIANSFAQIVFLSIEPMLSTIDLYRIPEAKSVNWIIVGGESGDLSRRREMSHSWVYPIRDFCLEHRIPFFFKQSSATRTEMGQSLRHEDGTWWIWEQYPDQLTPPQLGISHSHAHLDAPTLEDLRRRR